MILVLISDTHELHRDVDVPAGDILIHAGDIGFFSRQPSVYRDFNDWVGGLPHLHKILVPGNHDYLLETRAGRELIPNAHVLIGQGIVIDGLQPWGSPVNPYGNMPFGISDANSRREHWATMPEGTHVLITHMPPYGVLDGTGEGSPHQGCVELAEAVSRVKPVMHVFGHVHSCGGKTKRIQETLYVNAALAGPDGFLELVA